MQCPHCKENVSHVKGYVGKNQDMKSPFGMRFNILAMVFLCPNCETILGITDAGSKTGM
jgi:hypothetical protein